MELPRVWSQLAKHFVFEVFEDKQVKQVLQVKTYFISVRWSPLGLRLGLCKHCWTRQRFKGNMGYTLAL